jgi:hypothetical protein
MCVSLFIMAVPTNILSANSGITITIVISDNASLKEDYLYILYGKSQQLEGLLFPGYWMAAH